MPGHNSSKHIKPKSNFRDRETLKSRSILRKLPKLFSKMVATRSQTQQNKDNPTEEAEAAASCTMESPKRSEKSNSFICGVVEGFYGRPWTTDQRRELFKLMNLIKMNTYVYAPKDDLKHRANWRDLYTPEEAEHLQSLIEAATAEGIVFVYALSPGIDITYSNPKEVTLIKHKLAQVKTLGCNSFALLFDDIEPTMSVADKNKFTSFAHAQVTVTNEVYEHLEQPQFFFCPTEYCESRCVPSLEDSNYLNLIGKKLLPKIEVLWTGPRVISRVISVEHAKRVAAVLHRPLTVWDNLHANDYDNRRIFLGPYCGRPVELKSHIAGVLTNPNCECEANFVACHTLAAWAQADADAPTVDSGCDSCKTGQESDATLEAGGVEPVADEVTRKAAPMRLYHPSKAFQDAVDAWVTEFGQHRNAFGTPLMPVKPPDGVVIGINTCSVTTTTSSATPLSAGPSPSAAVHSSSSQLSVTSNTTHSGLYVTSGSTHPVLTPGPLPLYTPPQLAENIQNSFAAGLPPLVEALEDTAPSTVAQPADDPLLTPGMQAVNSLTDEYCEPMELAAQGMSTDTPSPTRLPCAVREQEIAAQQAATRPKSESDRLSTPLGTEMMEAKSAEDLSSSSPVNQSTASDTDTVVAMDTEKSPSRNATSQPTANAQSNVIVPTDEMLIDRDEGFAEDINHGGAQSAPVGVGDSGPSRAHVELMAELFYLPFEHGPQANVFLNEFIWLKANGAAVRKSIDTEDPEQGEEWRRRSSSFRDTCRKISEVLCTVAECPNRGLVYDFFPYLWELQGIVELLDVYVQWLSAGFYSPAQSSAAEDTPSDATTIAQRAEEPTKEAEVNSVSSSSAVTDYEPWIFRGGLIGELQKLLPMENAIDLFSSCRPPHPPSSANFKLRMAEPSDRKAIYDICRLTFDDLSDASGRFSNYPDLIGDSYAGSFLSLNDSCCFVIEWHVNNADCNARTLPNSKVVGFALGALNAQQFFDKVASDYHPQLKQKYAQAEPPPTTQSESASQQEQPQPLSEADVLREMREWAPFVPQSVSQRYPSVMSLRCLPDFNDTVASRRLALAVMSVLKSNGSTGVYVETRSWEKNLVEAYARIGLYEIAVLQEEIRESNNGQFLGRIL